MTSSHQPVLLQELLDALHIKPGQTVVDGTLGGAGHAEAIVERLGSEGVFIGIDRDRTAIERARKKLIDAKCTVHLIADSFRNIDGILTNLGIPKVDAIVLDLGLSSDQLNPPDSGSGRGFSFQRDEPLLMTFEFSPKEDAVTARDIVNEWEEEHIADILFGFGEERFSRRIARAVVNARKEKPIETTAELVRLIQEAVPRWYRFRKIHPATKTFQALRMAVNDELGALREVIAKGRELLTKNGRLAVITFHSVEDRVVKTLFSQYARDGLGSIAYKKPIAPGHDEVSKNPRARSAKLRVFEKA